MKYLNNLFLMFLAIPLFFTSCKNDGETITLKDVPAATLIASATKVELSNETSNTLMFSIAWNSGELSINDSAKYGLSNTAMTNTLEFDTLATFTNPKESVETGVSKSYTGSALNSFILSMGLKPGIAKTLYIRIKSSLGANMTPLYSNVANVEVTPYDVISFLYMPGVLAGDMTDFSIKLCSPKSDGTYEGYVNAKQWANFKFTTTTSITSGTVFGSLPNSLYALDANTDQWNIWFDEGGYFLVKANTNDLTWSKTAITSFSITGEFNAWSTSANTMTYDATNNVWTATCNLTTVLYGIQIIANEDWNFKYGDTNKNGSLLLGGSNINIDKPGTYVITMDLSNPEKYTYTIK